MIGTNTPLQQLKYDGMRKYTIATSFLLLCGTGTIRYAQSVVLAAFPGITLLFSE
jgi:hypothetical protein